jgi:6-phospho-beta-glucosidase
VQKFAKLTVIGGGSSYTPELLDGFIQHRDELSVEEIALYDIDEDRLAIVGGLAKRMIRRAALPTRVILAHDRRAAIKGADFVISQIRVGQMPARILDERTPLKFNVLGQETVGVGGIFKALRTIPVTLEIAKDVATLAPGAWFLNFTNPAGLITETLVKYSELERVVGLCNVPINSHRAVAELLGVADDRVWLDWLGLNHLGWIRGVYLDGQDVLPNLLQRLQDDVPLSVFERFPFDQRLLTALGLLPTYYLRYYYDTPRVMEEIQQAGRTRGEVVLEIEKALMEKYSDPTLDTKPPELGQRGGALYSEAAIRLISSLLSDRRDVQILIVRNNGAIADLPDDVAVEVPAAVGGQGITALSRGVAPLQVKPLLEAVKTSEILTLESAMTGSRKQLLQALLVNPLVPDYIVAERLMEELLKAHQDYLKQFS